MSASVNEHLTFHVVYGERGFDREVKCSPRKAARILQHEFERVERAGRGFLRIEHHRRSYRDPVETHYEYAPERDRGCRWLTNVIRLSF